MADAHPRLARSAGVIGIATMTSRLLGLVRDQVLAFHFGAGGAMDAFLVAFRIPNLVRDLFAEGAMSAAFVPTFTKRLAAATRSDAWRLSNSVINALIVVTGVLVLAAIVFAEPLQRQLAHGFTDTPEKFALTVQLTRVMVPFLTLVAIAAVLMGMLNGLGYFFIPALSPALFNVATVFCVVVIVPFAATVGMEPIMIVALSTLLGGIAQVAIQWPPLAREGFRYRPLIDLHDPALRQILVLMGPGTIGLAATQINVMVNTFLATREDGAVTWLSYAFRLMYLPIGLFGVSIATAATPTLSRQAHDDDFASMRSTVAHALGLMLTLNVPATVGLIALAPPIISVIFEHGSFTAADTAATAAALRWYALGLVGYSVVRIVSPTFYALGKSRIPVAVSVASVLLNVALNVMLVRVLGYQGLALGTSLAALLNAATQLVLLRHAIGGIQARRILVTLVKVAIASVLMGGAAWWLDHWLLSRWPDAALHVQMARLALTIAAALAILVLAATALRIREFEETRDLVVGRLRRMMQ